VNQTVKPALHNLGYNTGDIERVLNHVDKYDTIENVVDEQTGEPVASGLKEAHLSIFDCAFKPHQGTRSLHYRGHIRMMAACQPSLSGAISKTVNLPEEATVEEIMNTYLEGWQLGLKAIAIYRDGSKRSSPVSTKKEKQGTNGSSAHSDALAEVDAVANENNGLLARISELESENIELRKKADEPVRRRMPDTRLALNHKFDIAGHEGYINVGMFEDGQPGELFVQMQKEGSTIGGLMDTIGALTSMALQYGVPLESMVRKFAHQRFEPSGFTKNPDIRTATSITDYVFRWLACRFIKGYKEATSPNAHQGELPLRELPEMDKKSINRPVPELERTADKQVIDIVSHNGSSEGHPHISSNGHTHAERLRDALGNMFMDTPCSNCGSTKVIRAGACGCCTECGTSQGCS
jgi:ribonucleoside-diphosphate reductase alpha chain